MADGAPSPNFGGFAGSLTPFPMAQQVYDPYYDTVYDSIAPVTGDFNGDGIPDLATSQTDGSIDVLLGDGKGGFSAPIVTPSLSGDFSQGWTFGNMIAVDLNGDGKLDLVAWSHYGEVAIILNNGDATFGAPSYVYLYATPPGSYYPPEYETAVAVADVNGDGHPDLVGAVVSSTDAVSVNTIMNPGNGAFSSASEISTTSYTLPAGTTAWVFNDTGTIATIDGKLTMAFAAEEYPVTGGPPYAGYVFLAASNGDGTFTFNPSPVSIPSVTGTSASLVNLFTQFPWPEHVLRVQDLNNDGTPDILIALGDGYLYSAIGLGSGTFAPPVLAVPFSGFQLPDLELYDYDGDGWADLLDSENEYTAAFHGNGDGTFTLTGATMAGEPYTYAYGYDGAAPAGRLTAYGDFNGDGRPDVASIDNTYGVAVVSTSQQGLAFTGAPRLADNGAADQTPSAPPTTIAQTAVDLNGDGKTDIVGFNESGPELLAVVGINQGAGVFKWTSAPLLLNVPLVQLGFSSVAADFNHDGKPDLIVYGLDVNNAWHVYTALSNGDGTFQQPVEVVLPNGSTTNFYGELDQFAVGDLNGDGNIDIAMVYGSPYGYGTFFGYYVALGDGTGNFPTVTFTGTTANLDQLALADFNGDGALDLALSSTPDGPDPSLEVLLNDGKGNFGTLPPSIVSDTEIPITLFAADINQDGKADLVMSTEGYYSASSGQDFTQSGIAVYPGNGDGTFGERSLISEQGAAAGILLADFNGDGLPDILSGVVEGLNGDLLSTTEPFYGVSLLLNRGKGSFAPPINTFTPSGVGMLATGNFYGVGGTDLLVEDTLGESIFYNQGASTLALSASNAAVSQGDTVTLTAAVAAAMPFRPIPTGVVTFYDGGTAIGDVVLDGSGMATLTASSLAVGSNAITATYAGDENFNPATQASPVSITVTALPPAFSLSVSSSYVMLAKTGSIPLTLTLTPNATFVGSVTLAATGVPTGVTVQFSPSTVPLSGVESAQAVMTITAGQSTTASLKEGGPAWMLKTGAGISIAGLLLVFLPRRRRRPFEMLVLALAFSTALTVLSGCGGGSSQGPKSGTVQITITATPSSSGATAQVTTINLTIQ